MVDLSHDVLDVSDKGITQFVYCQKRHHFDDFPVFLSQDRLKVLMNGFQEHGELGRGQNGFHDEQYYQL